MTSPSPRTDDENPKPSYFLLPLDIIINPARAFERIAANPEWFVAYTVVVVLFVCAGWLQLPAVVHLNAVMSRAQHETPAAPNEILGRILLNSVAYTLFSIMIPTMTIAVIAVVRNIKNVAALPAILSLVANVTIIAAIGQVLSGAAMRLHDPSTFDNLRSLDMALPIRLTFLATPGNDAQANFLTNFGIFELWSEIVLAFGLVRLVKFDLTAALVIVFSIAFVLALFV